MLCLSLRSIPKLPLDPAVSIVELRLDLNPGLLKIRDQIDRPIILTDRGASCERLLAYKPSFIDTEQPIPGMNNLIYSYHNYDETPLDLEAIYRRMKKTPAVLYKIATHTKSSIDALRLANLSHEFSDLLAFGMGEEAQFSRFLAKPWIYCALDSETVTAPGQPTVEEAKNYLKSRTFALIGYPLTGSQSDKYHHAFFNAREIDAKYLKIPLQKDMLPTFFTLASRLGIDGLSITMPLKEHVIPQLDHIDQEAQAIGAVNTAYYRKGLWFGSNTDGKGALDALEKVSSVRGKRLFLIGRGGAAKAIGYEAEKRGATVILAGAKRGDLPLSHLPEHEILVNATPHPMPILHHLLQKGTLVMDIKNEVSPLLLAAKSVGCQIVLGSEMWVNQAVLQYHTWFCESSSVLNSMPPNLAATKL